MRWVFVLTLSSLAVVVTHTFSPLIPERCLPTFTKASGTARGASRLVLNGSLKDPHQAGAAARLSVAASSLTAPFLARVALSSAILGPSLTRHSGFDVLGLFEHPLVLEPASPASATNVVTFLSVSALFGVAGALVAALLAVLLALRAPSPLKGELECPACKNSRVQGCVNCDAVGFYSSYGQRVKCKACKGSGQTVCRTCFSELGIEANDLEGVREFMRGRPD